MQYTLKEIQAISRADAFLMSQKEQGMIRGFEIQGFEAKHLVVKVIPGMSSTTEHIGRRLADQLGDLGIGCNVKS